MKKENSNKSLPNRWEIYFYVLMGHIFYWINNAARYRFRSANKAKIALTGKEKENKISFKVDVINYSSGGDLSKNTEIMKHIQETPLNNKILTAAKNGTPLLTFGDGSKPRVMITAGVHGNELPPQIAALKLANELKDNLNDDSIDNRMRGTVYLIPFVAPAASGANDKHFKGQNLNLETNISGSLTNDVLKIAQELNITSLVDCHGTSTDPAKNAVIYFPKIGSSKIAVYINKKTSSTLLVLLQDPGMLITQCNHHQIPSVICEVKSADGVASAESIDMAYNQMKAFLSYHQIL